MADRFGNVIMGYADNDVSTNYVPQVIRYLRKIFRLIHEYRRSNRLVQRRKMKILRYPYHPRIAARDSFTDGMIPSERFSERFIDQDR